MTLIAQEIPKVGLVMEEVKVVRWLKNVGDQVVAGETLLEVETEKSLVEIEAAATGRLVQILVAVDSPAAGLIKSLRRRPRQGRREPRRPGDDARCSSHSQQPRRAPTRGRTRH